MSTMSDRLEAGFLIRESDYDEDGEPLLKITTVKANPYKTLWNLCTHNRELLEQENNASCFYCFQVYSPETITTWTDEQQTAICPECSIDSVLPGEFSQILLSKMHAEWFSIEESEG